jgi:hypothetical protein
VDHGSLALPHFSDANILDFAWSASSVDRNRRLARMAALETIVRAANGEDRASLFSLTSQFPTPTPYPYQSFSALLDSKLGDQSACILVAEHKGALISYVSASVRTAFYAAGPTA